MKKLSMIVLAAMTLLPSSMQAIERIDTVTNKNEFTAAITAANAAQVGDVYKIVCKWDAANPLSLGTIKPTMAAGTLIITSDETEYDKMPQMLVGFDWAGDLKDDGKFVLIFENVGLQYRTGKEATSGQIIYFNKRDAQMDSIMFRNCDISNYPRTLYRAVPKDKTEENENTRIKNIGKIEMTNCRVHDSNILTGNNWACIYPGQAVQEVVIKDNMFYDMPYCQAIFQMGYASEGTGTAPTFTFDNNTIIQAKSISADSTVNNRFQVINVGGYFGMGATFNINNNIFLAPQAGTYADYLKDGYHPDGVILNANSALVYASNNVVDPIAFKPIEEDSPSEESGNFWLDVAITNSYAPADAGITSWESGVTFQDPEKSLYYMLKSSPAYTMGVNGTYLGSANTYVDEFPVKANVNVTIDGPLYITYSLAPEKSQYYVGDEVTITLNDHNSIYRTFNTFKGWSDGSNEKVRTIVLEKDFNETATYANDNTVISAFDFSTIKANNNSLASYDADIYFNANEDYKATVKAIVCDTATSKVAPIGYIEGYFQGRPAKFGEDDEEMQMPIISRRTAAAVKEIQRDYALIIFSTKGMSNVKFSAYVGSDNNAAKTQALEYSTDSITWTRLASVDIMNGAWEELQANLPAELENQDRVLVRIIGDLTNGHIVTPDPSGGLVDDSGNEESEKYLAADAFEYIGNILISGDTSNGIVIVNNEKKASDSNAPIYNMMGMKVAKGTKGLLIQNGKKYLVK
ncbi:MAG: hypothetical protein ACI4TW_05915 [Prevotella sp.]